MDNRIHAQLMAQNCTPRIAQLAVRVRSEKPGEDVYQGRLISSLVHGSMMSNNCRYSEAKEMMYMVTERLFAEASPNWFGVQNDAHAAIVREISHASQMAVTAHERAEDIQSTVQPTTLDTLPTTQRELNGLRGRVDDATVEIRNITHQVLMDRTVRNIAGR
jgi:hypothetical protein